MTWQDTFAKISQDNQLFPFRTETPCFSIRRHGWYDMVLLSVAMDGMLWKIHPLPDLLRVGSGVVYLCQSTLLPLARSGPPLARNENQNL